MKTFAQYLMESQKDLLTCKGFGPAKLKQLMPSLQVTSHNGMYHPKQSQMKCLTTRH